MIIIMTTDFMFGNHLVKRGESVRVTNDYGKRLIANNVARPENFIEVLQSKKKKK